MDQRVLELIRQGNALFAKKRPIDSLHQELALNFYTARADFTEVRNEGDEFASHQFSSFPERARNEFGAMLSEFLRPQNWLSIHIDDDELDIGLYERAFLQHLTKQQSRAMYARTTNIVRATRQTDQDFTTFGNGVIAVDLNKERDGLLFQNYHIRDCAWTQDFKGDIACVHRNWSPTARQLVSMFPLTVSKDVRKCVEKEPEKTFRCRHIAIPTDNYSFKGKKKFPYASLYVEIDSGTILEEVGRNFLGYVIPRWQTVSGSAYGLSLITSILLPDSRTLQAVMRTLQEAGEKYVDPPMIAIADAIRGDIALYSGGVTTADMEYDERLGEVLRPISQNSSGMPIGFDIAQQLKEDLRSGFMLDKMQLPETTKEMTATEIRRRVQEHIRAASPLIKPIQESYNTPLCETVFQILLDNGVFPIEAMPETLKDKDIKFQFRSPLDQLSDESEADIFVDVLGRILVPVANVDPVQVENLDLTRATRESMLSAGLPARWLRPVEEVMQKKQQLQERMEQQAQLQDADAIGRIIGQGGKGVSALANASGQQQQG